MNITDLKINHMINPLGYLFKTVTASYLIENTGGKPPTAVQIIVAEDPEFHDIVFDTGNSNVAPQIGTALKFPLKPRTRYYWQVKAWAQQKIAAVSDMAWFETGLMAEGFFGEPISPCLPADIQPVFLKTFSLSGHIGSARLYICCLGVYEIFINGNRVGEEWLAPGVTNYDNYIQYQTYDIGSLLHTGENIIEVAAGDGWYKGMYGYRQNPEYRIGKAFELVADLYINGALIVTSDLSWKVQKSKVIATDIYNGETRDDTFWDNEIVPVQLGSLNKNIIKERLGVPIKVKEIVRPVGLLTTPDGEMVLDFGQNMVGRVAFYSRLDYGQRVCLEHGEILQENCFYNKNYRTAKARFEYISDGCEKTVSARHCFFGFRYVKLTGFADINSQDFWGEVIYSDLETTVDFKTGNQMLNQLISNIGWSQKGNFLDIPTDCPQRDEKLGWTGDAQIFAGTACLNMDCYQFFRKYLHEISLEQKQTAGLVPQIVPSVGRNERTSAAWGDAALIIPWTLYQHYGDASILEEQYESMKEWVQYIDRQNLEHGTNPDLWQNGFHYGDWLALDGGYYHMPTGGTDVYYISSAYFYYSVTILSKTAAVLGKTDDFVFYQTKAKCIQEEIQNEYFTPNGRLCMDTQTAYVVAIVFGLIKDNVQFDKIKEQFLLRLRKDGYCLKTGFVGTPFLLEALSQCGCSDIAYQILLSKEYPGWLYPITLGATTMWERWDALNPDGSISDNGMNSFNHYANGAVLEWMYRYIAGISQQVDSVGYKKVNICPNFHADIGWADVKLKTASGCYRIKWEIVNENHVKIDCTIPCFATARMLLTYVDGMVSLNGNQIAYSEGELLRLDAGNWQVEYQLCKDYRSYFSLEDSVRELVKNSEVKAYLYKKIPMLIHTDKEDIQHMTLVEMSRLPFFLGIGTKLGLEASVLDEVEAFISKIPK